MKRTYRASGIGMIAGAGISFGTIPLFVTWLTQDGVGTWLQLGARLLVSVVVLLIPLVTFARVPLRVASRQELLFVLRNGLLMLISNATYVFSIALGTPPTKAVLLNHLSPIYVSLLGVRFLGEGFTRRKLAAIMLGLTGIGLILKVWEVSGLTDLHLGDALAFATGLTYATMVILGRWSGLRDETHPRKLSFWTFVFALSWITLFGLFALGWYGPSAIASQLPRQMTLRVTGNLLGLALAGGAVPFTLMYMGLERVEAGTASIILLAEPVSVFIFSSLFLHESIGWWQIAGGALILGAGVLVAR